MFSLKRRYVLIYLGTDMIVIVVPSMYKKAIGIEARGFVQFFE